MTGDSDNEHADRSSALFNNRYLVSVVRAIADLSGDGAFTTRQIAAATSLPDSLVRPVIQRLLSAQLLHEDYRLPGLRGAKFLRVSPGTPWSKLNALCEALAGA